jgi:hypothetical protein
VTDYVGLVRSLDELYRTAAAEPASWSEGSAAEWASEVFVEPPPRPVARHVRAALRMSVKLAAFWRDPPAGVPADSGDWVTRVDLALGARAWRPLLEVARHGLDETPTEELFEEVKERFRVVHNQHWMDGIDYEEWRQERSTRM